MLKKHLCFGVLPWILLSGCGGSSSSSNTPTYSISGGATISTNTCSAYTVTRSVNVSSDTTIQPGLTSGQGAVYSNSNCTTVAFLNIQMPSGSNTATFYFKTNSPGTTVLEVTDVTNSIAQAASYTVAIQ
jgi:hypothetical protein